MANKRKNRSVFNSKFDSKKRGKYNISYIEELRLKVKMTCSALEPKRFFDFDSTKQSVAYSALDELLNELGYPELNTGTLNNFFTKSPFDDNYNFEEYYSFEERTINILSDFVDNNLFDIPKEIENNNRIIPPDENGVYFNNLKNLLQKLYTKQSVVCAGESEVTIMENGDAKMCFKVFVSAKSEIFNLLVNIYADHNIRIKQIEAVEVVTRKKLNLIPFEENANSFMGYILLEEPIKSGENFFYQFDAFIEKYYLDLVSNSTCNTQRYIVNKRYTSCKDIFRFPNTKMFENVSIHLLKHPTKELIGKNIDFQIIDDHKVFDFRNDNLYETQSLIEYKIQI